MARAAACGIILLAAVLAFPLPAARPASHLPPAQPAAPPAPPVGPSPSSEDAQKKKEEERKAREAYEARLKEIRRKIETLNNLIKQANEALKLRTSGPDVFERKRALENQLRDYITLFSLTDQAIAEAERLAREVEEILQNVGKGPRDPQRLQLANFLEARRREYVLFGMR